ncbi:MAG: NAD(P)H-quinone oxidoreductase [Gammaproteobacteria bacterium]|nr:NAD(P)H-quinone oxidoreductase [Gammaproteobacteria bacterium]MDP6694047.1 NAD(P)H-quinone oxidoreductase [Gammaproteobacteria bacterium]
MRAVEISTPGDPDVLQLIYAATPAPAADEVLIRVVAAGVNRPDCLQRRGLYPPPPGASELPGLEVAGIVRAAGAGVTTFKPGDSVCALLAGGGYAEYSVAPAVQCLPIPAGLSFAEAAVIPETFFTVWTNVFDRGQLQAGESILVHGGASGIGTTAIQLARALGAEVYATAGSDEKVALCERLGAKRAVNYNTDDFAAVIGAATDDNGVDLIFDIVGGTYLDRNIKLLARDGRLVVIGVLGGAKAELNLGQVLLKRLTITGSTLRSRPAAEKGGIAAALREHVWPLLESGEIKPVVQQSWPLAEAAAAHTLLEANGAAGKLVLSVDPELADTVPA